MSNLYVKLRDYEGTDIEKSFIEKGGPGSGRRPGFGNLGKKEIELRRKRMAAQEKMGTLKVGSEEHNAAKKERDDIDKVLAEKYNKPHYSRGSFGPGMSKIIEQDDKRNPNRMD